MIRKQIQSRKDGLAPFYGLSVDNGNLTVESDHDGGLEADLSGQSIDLPESGIVAVSSEAELFAGYIDESPSLRAGLGYHNGSEWVIYEFIE